MSDTIHSSEEMNGENSSYSTDYLKQLQEKYQNAYMDFALNGYKKSIARAVTSLSDENRQKIFAAYSRNFFNEIAHAIEQISSETSAYTERELKHIITQQNIISPQDFIEIEEYLKKLAPSRLEYALETLRDIDSRLYDFANRIALSELKLNYVKLMSFEEIQILLNTVNMYNFKIVLKYADDEFKNAIFGNISKNRGALLREDISFVHECTQEEIAEAKRNLIAEIIEMDKRKLLNLSRFNEFNPD